MVYPKKSSVCTWKGFVFCHCCMKCSVDMCLFSFVYSAAQVLYFHFDLLSGSSIHYWTWVLKSLSIIIELYFCWLPLFLLSDFKRQLYKLINCKCKLMDTRDKLLICMTVTSQKKEGGKEIWGSKFYLM